MNRRGFLRGAIGAAAALAVGEAFLPKRSIFLPPRGGWPIEIDFSQYLTNPKTAWFLKTGPFNNHLPSGAGVLTEESLERALIELRQAVDHRGVPLHIRPTRVLVHPSWTRQQVTDRLGYDPWANAEAMRQVRDNDLLHSALSGFDTAVFGVSGA